MQGPNGDLSTGTLNLAFKRFSGYVRVCIMMLKLLFLHQKRHIKRVVRYSAAELNAIPLQIGITVPVCHIT
jgi:hypothetical protein